MRAPRYWKASLAAISDFESGARVVGVNMRRFLLSTAVALYLSVPAAIAAARYGE